MRKKRSRVAIATRSLTQGGIGEGYQGPLTPTVPPLYTYKKNIYIYIYIYLGSAVHPHIYGQLRDPQNPSPEQSYPPDPLPCCHQPSGRASPDQIDICLASLVHISTPIFIHRPFFLVFFLIFFCLFCCRFCFCFLVFSFFYFEEIKETFIL